MHDNGISGSDELQLVYYTNQIHQATIFKAMLEENNIPYKEINKIDSSYGTFGYIEFYVFNKNFDQARDLAIDLEQ